MPTIADRGSVEGYRHWAKSLQDTVEYARVAASAAGIEPATWLGLPTRLSFVVCRIHGAQRAASGSDPTQWTEELLCAGVAIGCTLTDLYRNEWSVRPPDDRPVYGFTPVEVLLWRVLDPIVIAMREWRPLQSGHVNARVAYQLERAFSRAIALYEAVTAVDASVEMPVAALWWEHPAQHLIKPLIEGT